MRRAEALFMYAFYSHLYMFEDFVFYFVSFARTFLMSATQIKCVYKYILCECNRWQCDLMHTIKNMFVCYKESGRKTHNSVQHFNGKQRRKTFQQSSFN